MNLSLLPAHTVSARQGPLPGQLVQCRQRTVTSDPGLVNPDSFMEASRSAGALCEWLFMAVYGCVGLCSCDSSGGEDGQARRGSNHILSIPSPHPNLPRRFYLKHQ